MSPRRLGNMTLKRSDGDDVRIMLMAVMCAGAVCAGCTTPPDGLLRRGDSARLECETGFVGEMRVTRDGESVLTYMATNKSLHVEARCRGRSTEMFIQTAETNGWKLHLLTFDGTNVMHTVVRNQGKATQATYDRDGDGHPEEEKESEQGGGEVRR